MNIVCSCFVNVLVTAIVVVAEVSIVSNKDVSASREDSYFSDNDVDVDRTEIHILLQCMLCYPNQNTYSTFLWNVFVSF